MLLDALPANGYGLHDMIGNIWGGNGSNIIASSVPNSASVHSRQFLTLPSSLVQTVQCGE